MSDFITVLALVFFQGFGWGSERRDISTVSVILLVLPLITNLFDGTYTRMATAPPTIIAVSLVAAVVIFAVDFGAGYYIGKRWFRRTH